MEQHMKSAVQVLIAAACSSVALCAVAGDSFKAGPRDTVPVAVRVPTSYLLATLAPEAQVAAQAGSDRARVRTCKARRVGPRETIISGC